MASPMLSKMKHEKHPLFHIVKKGGVMLRFFSFRWRRKEREADVNSLLLARLDRMIELLEKQQKNMDGKSVHLDHVQIDHLENIIFRLDSLEIDELSGKLLIGNNISGPEDLAATLMQKVDKDKAKQEKAAEPPPAKQTKATEASFGKKSEGSAAQKGKAFEDAPINREITKTSKGYSYRNHL